jgi:hypothetical protein
MNTQPIQHRTTTKPNTMHFTKLITIFSLALITASCARMPKLPPEQARTADYGRAPTAAEVATASRQFATFADREFQTTFARQTPKTYSPFQGYIGIKNKDGTWRYEFGYLVHVWFNEPVSDNLILLRNGILIYYKPFLDRWRSVTE